MCERHIGLHTRENYRALRAAGQELHNLMDRSQQLTTDLQAKPRDYARRRICLAHRGREARLARSEEVRARAGISVVQRICGTVPPRTRGATVRERQCARLPTGLPSHASCREVRVLRPLGVEHSVQASSVGNLCSKLILKPRDVAADLDC